MTDQSAINKAYHREMYLRSLDTWLVANPDEKDFVIYFDRKGPNMTSWVIPGKEKDLGHGKGQKQVPAYIMRLYLNKKGTEMINEMILKDWEKKKKQYRDDERGIKEETLALKSNDPNLWNIVTPQLVKGIVSRFGGEDIVVEEESEQAENPQLSPGEAAMARLGLADKDIEEAKNTFMKGIS